MFTFEYANDRQYPSLSEKFYDSFENNSKEKLRKKFMEDGIIGVDIGSLDEKILLEKFNAISSLIGTGLVRDAMRRTKNNNTSKNINEAVTVDPDDVHRPHSEASFSPAKPAVICFICTEIEKKAIDIATTTIMDGNKIWKELDIETKKCLLNSEITYDLAIDIPLNAKNQVSSRREWYLDAVGVENVEIDRGLGKMFMNFKTPFVTDHPLTRELSLANHAFINPITEAQIINRRVNLTKNSSHNQGELISNVIEVIRNNIKTIKWKKGRCLLIDNYRFMHGRLPYNMNLTRKILIKQFKKFALI